MFTVIEFSPISGFEQKQFSTREECEKYIHAQLEIIDKDYERRVQLDEFDNEFLYKTDCGVHGGFLILEMPTASV